MTPRPALSENTPVKNRYRFGHGSTRSAILRRLKTSLLDLGPDRVAIPLGLHGDLGRIRIRGEPVDDDGGLPSRRRMTGDEPWKHRHDHSY